MVSVAVLPLFDQLNDAFNRRDPAAIVAIVDLPTVFIGDAASVVLETREQALEAFDDELATLDRADVVDVHFRPISETASSTALSVVKCELVLTFCNGDRSDPKSEHVIIRTREDRQGFAAIVGPQIFDVDALQP